jgi:hypothetical protein
MSFDPERRSESRKSRIQEVWIIIISDIIAAIQPNGPVTTDGYISDRSSLENALCNTGRILMQANAQQEDPRFK